MGIDKKYSEVLGKLEAMGQKRKLDHRYPAMGLTSNLDLLCNFNTDKLNELLQEYLPAGRLDEMKPAKEIHTIQELLETIVFFCRNGIGGEVDIADFSVIRDSFQWNHGMGGTAVQAALALQSIGCPSIVHLTDDSKEVCDILNCPEIYVVSEDGSLISTSEVVQTQEQEIHGIIQFRKGDIICLGDQRVEIPLSNRLILTKVTVNETVPFYQPYFRYIIDHAEQISSYVISSFNCIQNIDILRERLEYIKKHIREYRKKNPDGIVFFEDAHYHNEEIRRLCMSYLYPEVDIVSLNEEEIQHTLKGYGIAIDIENLQSCVKGVNAIRDKFHVQKGVIVHTKDYSMYAGNPIACDVESGLICGNLLATAKAVNGWYGNLEQIQRLMQYPLSVKGMEFREQAASLGLDVIVVPTRYVERPPHTIGLGDSFVAGVQMCF